jgi:hypothetical protein
MHAYRAIKYGSRVGCWTDVFVRRPAAPAQWWLASLVLVSGAGCALERTPELQENTRALNGIPLPPRMVDEEIDEDRFGERPDQGPIVPEQTGGIQCGGIFCPFVVSPVEQCCTDQEDVVRGTARNEERCGLSFAKAGVSSFGNGCWQRDQGGIVDDSCPPLLAPDGNTELEPGCCSDQGLCGTMNVMSAVGCHYADGAEKTSCVDEVDPGHECNPLGIFGARIAVDVAWGGRSGGLVGLTDDGRADLTVHLRLEIQEIDGRMEITGAARPCSVDLPQFFSTTLCESYKPIFPNTIWESPNLPPIDLTGRYSCLGAGCVLTIDAVTSLIGMSLENPEAPWPLPKDTPIISCPEGKGIDCFVDHDDDDLPGLTINVMKSGRVAAGEAPKGTTCAGIYDYFGAPLSASAGALTKIVRRADRIHLGTRTKLGGSSVLGDECMNGLGTGIAEFVQSRAWGCMVQEGTTDDPFAPGAGPNEPCESAEAAFMDENLPIYDVLAVGESPTPPISVPNMSPSEGPKIQIVRLGDLGDQVDCDAVRNAPYPR